MKESEQAREVARRLGVAAHPDTELVAEAVAMFAPLGWAMCGHWHRDGTLRALRLAGDNATSEEIDDAITEVWNDQNRTWLQHAAAPIRRWSNSHYPFKQVLWDRVSLIEKAIAHHFAGAYEASAPITLAQIDGMSRKLTGKSFFSKANDDPYMDDETLAGMEANLPVVRRVFSEDVRPSGHYGKVSRHGVMHGRDLSYASRVNSTKTIVLVAALAEYLPRVADDVGARFRKDHEDQVTGSTEVDEIGRLADDREVPRTTAIRLRPRLCLPRCSPVEPRYLRSPLRRRHDRAQARSGPRKVHRRARHHRMAVALHDPSRTDTRLCGPTVHQHRM